SVPPGDAAVELGPPLGRGPGALAMKPAVEGPVLCAPGQVPVLLDERLQLRHPLVPLLRPRGVVVPQCGDDLAAAAIVPAQMGNHPEGETTLVVVLCGLGRRPVVLLDEAARPSEAVRRAQVVDAIGGTAVR